MQLSKGINALIFTFILNLFLISFFTENDSQKMEQVIQKYTKVKTNLIVENPYYYSDISELNKKIKK